MMAAGFRARDRLGPIPTDHFQLAPFAFERGHHPIQRPIDPLLRFDRLAHLFLQVGRILAFGFPFRLHFRLQLTKQFGLFADGVVAHLDPQIPLDLPPPFLKGSLHPRQG